MKPSMLQLKESLKLVCPEIDRKVIEYRERGPYSITLITNDRRHLIFTYKSLANWSIQTIGFTKRTKINPYGE